MATRNESVTCTLVTPENPFIQVPRSTIPTRCYIMACFIHRYTSSSVICLCFLFPGYFPTLTQIASFH